MTSRSNSHLDMAVDEEIFSYLNPDAPRSFFLYAGAGSGKTRSLVTAIDRFRREYRNRFALSGRRIGVITYTNAACDEIKQRLEYDHLVEVSTIHSFAWTLIGNYHADIKAWLKKYLIDEIEDLRAAQTKGRSGTKAARDREQSILSKQRRLDYLPNVKRFVYSPTGDNRGHDSLNHSEVIKITSEFLISKPTLQKILVDGFPILFIDESQDTNRNLMDAFLTVQARYGASFCMGLFGDTMQRIYADGKVGLEDALPDDWAKPVKRMNWRCPERVIKLINKIRSTVDGQVQVGKEGNPEGCVRLFVVPHSVKGGYEVEGAVAQRMAKITGDECWSEEGKYKALILEHHMAARRLGFSRMFDPLYAVEPYRTGLLDGTLSGLKFFADTVAPMLDALKRKDRFAVAAIAREKSPLLDRKLLRDILSNRSAGFAADGGDLSLKEELSSSTSAEDRKKAFLDVQLQQLTHVKAATESLAALFSGDKEPSFYEVLQEVSRTDLFEIPETLRFAVSDGSGEAEIESEDEDEVPDARSERVKAWQTMLSTPFSQIYKYSAYVKQEAMFDTHQGVKGREFPRVMVIIDDEEARGFLFSYGKLLGVKKKSETDINNERSGNETSNDRTRRLFYVTCSRAEASLAIVAYAQNPEMVKANAIAEGWFEENEIEVIDHF